MNNSLGCRLKIALVTAMLLGSFGVSGCATVRVAESNIYRPQKGGALTAEALSKIAPEYLLEPQTVVAADGVHLSGVLLRRPQAKKTILFFGGNNFVVERGAHVARILSPLNVNIMMMDYRGYGTSMAENPSFSALMPDALSIYDHLASMPGMSGNVIVHGHSLGSFMAGYVAANRTTSGLVLHSSATTAQDFARNQIPGIAKSFVKIRVDEALQGQGNLQHMKTVTEPMLIIVGANDAATTPAMSQKLFHASTLPPACKHLAVIEGAGHNDVFEQKAAIDVYQQFINGGNCG